MIYSKENYLEDYAKAYQRKTRLFNKIAKENSRKSLDKFIILYCDFPKEDWEFFLAISYAGYDLDFKENYVEIRIS